MSQGKDGNYFLTMGSLVEILENDPMKNWIKAIKHSIG